MAIEVNRARSMVYLPLIKPEKKDGHRASSMVYIPLLIFASLLISHRLLRTSLQFEVDHSEFDAPCLSMRNATAILKPLQANNSLPPTPDAVIEWLPPCTKSLSFWKDCDPGPGSIDVVLTIFKRPNLRQQLEMLVNSTLQPGNIFVYQSETHQNVPPIVKHFKESFPNFKVPIHIVQAPVDTAGYHGRFFIAYSMSRARYISVWDDDLMVGTRWLERVTKFMASHNDKVIVSSGGRVVDRIFDPRNNTEQAYGVMSRRKSPVDFIIQTYNLRRELLRYWLGSPVYTYNTGEDIQLAFALQKYGVRAYKLGDRGKDGQSFADGSSGMGANSRKYASYKKKRQEPRKWLLCKLVLEGFQMQQCTNCDKETAQRCVEYMETIA